MSYDETVAKALHLQRATPGMTFSEAMAQVASTGEREELQRRYFAETQKHNAGDRRGALDGPAEPKRFGDSGLHPDDERLADKYANLLKTFMGSGMSLSEAHVAAMKDRAFSRAYNRRYSQPATGGSGVDQASRDISDQMGHVSSRRYTR